MGKKDEIQPIIDMNYVDGITVVDNKGRIVYSIRYNLEFDETANRTEYKEAINKNLLEIYPTLDPKESTILNCLEQGNAIYKKHQIFHDYNGKLLNTQNLTIPIIRRGKVLGAIELSKEITTFQDVSKDNNEVIESNIYSEFNNKNFKETSEKYQFENIITRNKEMLHNIEKAKMIANSPSSVLIYGETGTGKELFVQGIHNYSLRKDRPFIAQNCAALPETLFESILFGTTKGAFTGANDRPGLFELADGGTLFLDEINSMPIGLQSKLLRVLQDGFVRRIGGTKEKKVDVRIIAAMNDEPVKVIKQKQIREDLFYRLNVMSINLVPLRERREDIPLLVDFFIKKYNLLFKKSVRDVHPEVQRIFNLYSWPGNVRELQHIIESSMNIVCDRDIDIKHLPAYLSNMEQTNDYIYVEGIGSLNDALENTEINMIKKALEKSAGNISKAAKLLKIPRQTLQYKMSKYKIETVQKLIDYI